MKKKTIMANRINLNGTSYHGAGAIAEIANEAKTRGYKKAFVCSDPDLIVRTGGDIRLSNFLLWQAAYAELYFTDTLWPDLTPHEIDHIVADFYKRKRRYGGV